MMPSLPAAADPSVLSREEALALSHRVLAMGHRPLTEVLLYSTAFSTIRFSHNQVDDVTYFTDRVVIVKVRDGSRTGIGTTRALDDEGLKRAVAAGELLAHLGRVPTEIEAPSTAPPPRENPALWQEATLGLSDPAFETSILHDLLETVTSAGMVCAGELQFTGTAMAVANNSGRFDYGRSGPARFMIGVRTPAGTGSGWGGWIGSDWTRVNQRALTADAIDIARRSMGAAAIEPGRYTVVLSPEVVGWFVRTVAKSLSAEDADQGRSPFSRSGGGNKLGLKVLDERIALTADPMDPEGGFIGFDKDSGNRFERVAWVEQGVLRNLAYPATYAHTVGHTPLENSEAMQMSGGTDTVDAMIASTKRGLLVHRIGGVSPVGEATALVTGVTRDGLFLIEDGKVTRPVKNMRFLESPLFIFNKVEAMGPPERAPIWTSGPYVAPPMKVRDFNFIGLSDAV